jgi:beta-glucosidase
MDRHAAPTAIEDRAAVLLERMTVDEKLAQLGCLWVTELVAGDRFDADRAASRLRHGMGQVTRIGASTGLLPAASAELMNDIQRAVVEGTRLGIPVIVHEESTGGFCARDATVFPQGIGLASTWDPELVGRVADVIRRQMRAVGARHTLAPVLDVARDPRWGRVEETYGEDPVLSGTIGTAYVRGLQTDDLADGVAATGKHFLGYALPEGGMNHAPVHVGPRELREVFAEPFAAVIRDAGLATVMNSYSSVDGLPCAGSRSILTGLLREELGFDGVVVADYFAVSLLATHHRVAAGPGAAAVRALTAGLDMELPSVDCFGAPLRAELDAGRVGMDVVDAAVRRVLLLKLRLGLFEHPYVDAGRAAAEYQTPAQRSLAREAVARSAVLLTNDGVLPLHPGVARLAVIGPGADDRRLLQGDYHYPAHLEIIYGAGGADVVDLLPAAGGAFRPGPFFSPHVTPLDGIRRAVGTGTTVVHARGCDVTGGDRSGIAEAVAAAESCDVAVVVVAGRSGLVPECTVGEARDAVDLRLTGCQEDLVAAVAATGTPTVVVVMSGRPHALGDPVGRAAAVVLLWPPGEEGGNGLADVLFGSVNPAGRLPVTLPRSVGQVPIHAAHRAGGGRSQFYGDYSDSPASPLFAFGHGLAYTTFGYGPLVLTAGTTSDPVGVVVPVTNTGERPGEEVVQLYVSDAVASVARPDRSLAGFARVPLAPGETRQVGFLVHPSRLAFYDETMRFVVEPGRFTLGVGASSDDIRSEGVVDLAGPVAEFRQRDVVATAVTVV